MDSQNTGDVGHDVPSERLIERKRFLACERIGRGHEGLVRDLDAGVGRGRSEGQTRETERGERERD